DFTFNVDNAPTKDALPPNNRSGKQLVWKGEADAVDHTTGDNASGTGSVTTSFPAVTTSTNPPSGTLPVTLNDTGNLVGTTVTGQPPVNSATGTVTFTLYDPTDPTCAGPGVFSEGRDVVTQCTFA